ncbi:hypothetical protein LNQ03_04900 [Klebsiella pneumoniae subsp. pneumoniae]|nr:hypothetical protein [Klebsiella pneumoniae subsp. pneumoniae]
MSKASRPAPRKALTAKSKLMVEQIPDRPAESPAGVEHCPAALLQPGRRPPVGRHGEDPQGSRTT